MAQLTASCVAFISQAPAGRARQKNLLKDPSIMGGDPENLQVAVCVVQTNSGFNGSFNLCYWGKLRRSHVRSNGRRSRKAEVEKKRKQNENIIGSFGVRGKKQAKFQLRQSFDYLSDFSTDD